MYPNRRILNRNVILKDRVVAVTVRVKASYIHFIFSVCIHCFNMRPVSYLISCGSSSGRMLELFSVLLKCFWDRIRALFHANRPSLPVNKRGGSVKLTSFIEVKNTQNLPEGCLGIAGALLQLMLLNIITFQ